MNIKELIAKRLTLANEAKALIPTDKRSMSAESNEQFDRIHKEIDNLAGEIARLDKQEKLEAELASPRSTIAIDGEVRANFDSDNGNMSKADDNRLRSAWRSYLKSGTISNELRSLTEAGGNAQGAYVAPAISAQGFEIILRDYIDIRSAPVTILPTNGGNSFPYPTVNFNSSSGGRTTEGSTIGQDTSTPFGNVTFGAYPYDSQIIQLSLQLIQDSVIPIDDLLNNEIAQRIGVSENYDLTLGTGTSQPQGIITGAGASGVTLAATSLGSDSGVAQDNLLALAYSVAPVYRNKKGVGYMCNDQTVLAYRKLRDSQNRPLWQPALTAGEPDTLNGFAVYRNSAFPLLATGQKALVFGDFSKYVVRVVNGIQVIRLVERYAENGMVGYKAWHRIDGHVVNNTALKYAVCA